MHRGFDDDDASDQGSITGTRDLTYNLISLIYHALQGAETCEKYLKDAYEVEDTELVQYFHDVQRQQQRIAEQGKELLGQRLSQDHTR
jgi:hypothetical protein